MNQQWFILTRLPMGHDGEPATLIRKTRDWLSTVTHTKQQPGGAAIARHFLAFQTDIVAICERLKLERDDLTFGDYGNVVRAWLTSLHSIASA